MRKIELQMNKAIEDKKDWSKDNTSVSYNEELDCSIVRLYGNKIAEIYEGKIVLFDGGFQSVTTKSRLNAIIDGNGGFASEGVFQKDWDWFVRIYDYATKTFNVVDFQNGLILA